VGHSNSDRPLFSMLQRSIGLLQPIRIFQSGDGIGKINAMFAAVKDPLGFVPLIITGGKLPDTGSHGNMDVAHSFPNRHAPGWRTVMLAASATERAPTCRSSVLISSKNRSTTCGAPAGPSAPRP